MMRSFVLAVLLLESLRAGGCGSREDPARAAPSAARTAPAERRAPPNAPFKVVDLFDLQHRPISRFSYRSSTQELFVTFDRTPREAEDVLYQWSVAKERLITTYTMERGFMVDDLSPSPDGLRLVAALYRTDDRASAHFEKYALLDTTSHRTIAGDLGIYDNRTAKVDFGTTGEHFRVTVTDPMGGPEQQLVYDASGRKAAATPSEFPPMKKGKVWVIESTKTTGETHGLYYTDEGGKDYRITPDHWHDNYDITGDGQYVVTTTWDGEILAFSTAEKRVVWKQKIADQYGYLAYDHKDDRFLLGDATSNGTTYLRALVRAR